MMLRGVRSPNCDWWGNGVPMNQQAIKGQKEKLTHRSSLAYIALRNNPCSFGERAQGRFERIGPCFVWRIAR